MLPTPRPARRGSGLRWGVRCEDFETGRCRSCPLLPVPYPEQVTSAVDGVRALLDPPARQRWGTPPRWLAPATSPEAGFRNKAKLAVGGSVDAPVLGIPALPDGPDAGLTDVTDLTRCPLYIPALAAALPALRDFVTTARLVPYHVASRTGELKFLLVTAAPGGALMVRFVARSRECEARLRKHLPALLDALPGIAVVSLNVQPTHAAVLEGPEEIVLHGETLTMEVAGLPLHLRPRSFFQTNTAVAGALYEQATAWLTALDPAPRSLWDLYCGVGGFGLHAARALPGLAVLGVEVSAEAVASAQRTAREAGIRGVRFEAGDALALARDALARSGAPDVAVVNPPRRGIGAELAASLERSGAGHVVYSSCNPTSLARDLAAMPSLRPREARLLDMFPNTRHAEVIVLLERERS